MTTVLRFTVFGAPAPKGSMVSFWNPRSRRVVTRHDNPKTVGWQLAVTAAAIKARGMTPMIAGPVAVQVTFALARAASNRDQLPITKRADLDKLARVVLDALSKALVYGDDSQVVSLAARKIYSTEPCAHVEVYAVGESAAEVA